MRGVTAIWLQCVCTIQPPQCFLRSGWLCPTCHRLLVTHDVIKTLLYLNLILTWSAMTIYYRLDGLINRNSFSHSYRTGHASSRGWQCWFFWGLSHSFADGCLLCPRIVFPWECDSQITSYQEAGLGWRLHLPSIVASSFLWRSCLWAQSHSGVLRVRAVNLGRTPFGSQSCCCHQNRAA